MRMFYIKDEAGNYRVSIPQVQQTIVLLPGYFCKHICISDDNLYGECDVTIELACTLGFIFSL